MKRNVIVFGLISGLMISVFMVGGMAWCYSSEKLEGSMVVGFSAMLLAFSLIFVAVKNYRDKYNNGVVSFGKAFQIGALIALIGSSMYVLSWGVEYHFFMPDFMDKLTAHNLKVLQGNGVTAAQIAEKTKEFSSQKEMYGNPVLFALITYVEILPVGLIVSVIAALILKRKLNKGGLATA
ncbi:DUF4199 domain-containing protein [Mucilaginibacter sp.]|uniref:DUF4199 domain-containing protein n=1 Tax=Mucilaginibacter sp. TaxID=1882438 RepID=UPI003266413D